MRIANLNLMGESITQIFAKFLAVSMCLYLYLHLLTIAVSIDETTDNYRGSTLSLSHTRVWLVVTHELQQSMVNAHRHDSCHKQIALNSTTLRT